MNPIRMLFLAPVDSKSTNAQSLNAREIALRLDPEKFRCTMLYQDIPDDRLLKHQNINLLKLPPHNQTLRILRELFGSHDVVAYMNYSPACYAFLRAPRFLRGKTKTVFHAEAPLTQLVNPPWLLATFLRGVLGFCDLHTAITQYVASEIAEKRRCSFSYVLPVGVDCDFFIPPPQRSNVAPTVLFAGTLIERKGPQYVIEAAARFPQANFRLVGAGRDGYETFLHNRIQALNLHNVELLGPKSQKDLAAIMQQGDIFLLPSRLEGLPKVTLEASATALPCIVFSDYQTPSVIDGVTGYQVKTVEEMLDRVGQLISQPALRETLGEAARVHAQKFDWDLVTQLWAEAYSDAAGR